MDDRPQPQSRPTDLPGRRRERTSQRREQILVAALGCFARTGVDRATVADLIAEAGCSVGSLYHHFGSKEGVAVALYMNGVDSFNAGLMDRLQRCKTVSEGVKALVRFYAD